MIKVTRWAEDKYGKYGSRVMICDGTGRPGKPSPIRTFLYACGHFCYKAWLMSACCKCREPYESRCSVCSIE